MLTRGFTKLLIPFSFAQAAESVTPFHLSPSGWWVWPLGLVVTDLCYYWAHRADHQIRILWVAHSVHHSSRYFNLSTGMRRPWLYPGIFTLRGLAFVPAAMIGFPAWMIGLSYVMVFFYQIPVHTERIGVLPGPVEFIFNTPSHHRVHHGSNAQYLDRNFGGILILWDRIFGTFTAEREPVLYGTVHDVDSFNPLVVNYGELVSLVRDVRSSSNWSARLRHVLGRPG